MDLIDHVSVFIDGGIRTDVKRKLDRVTRLYITDKRGNSEWRLALEGFAGQQEFSGASDIYKQSAEWRSITPFLATRYFSRSADRGEQYENEIINLMKKRGLDKRFTFDAEEVSVKVAKKVPMGRGLEKRAIQFHRFRSRGNEKHPDTTGAMLVIKFPKEISGPLALGYASHFGLGLFVPLTPEDEERIEYA